jgi:hypothetical protein
MTTDELEESIHYYKDKDPKLETRAQFMYNYLDYENDRVRVRTRFI